MIMFLTNRCRVVAVSTLTAQLDATQNNDKAKEYRNALAELYGRANVRPY